MSQETIRLSLEPPLATIRLWRPERMNAVTETMYRELGQALARVERETEVRVSILTGSSARRDGTERHAFCAGADVKEHAAGRRGPAERRAYIELAHDTVRAIVEHPKPVLAAVNGPARGAGAELALACDLVLFADEATLGFPETALGTFVGGGLTHVLPRLVGLARAKELVFTGRVVDGRAAVSLGLALASYPRAELDDHARALALEIARKAPFSLALAKRHLLRAPGLPVADALREETEAILACMETADWHEGLRAFREKREPHFEGR